MSKKCYIVNANIDIIIESYSIVGAELKARDLIYTIDSDDFYINNLTVKEYCDEQED